MNIIWVLALVNIFIFLAMMPFVYLNDRFTKPSKRQKYYEKWLRKHSLEDETDHFVILGALNEDERNMSTILHIVSIALIVLLPISVVHVLVRLPHLFVEFFAPVYLLWVMGLIMIHLTRTKIMPKTYMRYREIAGKQLSSNINKNA